jgi:hypothetical protein
MYSALKRAVAVVRLYCLIQVENSRLTSLLGGLTGLLPTPPSKKGLEEAENAGSNPARRINVFFNFKGYSAFQGDFSKIVGIFDACCRVFCSLLTKSGQISIHFSPVSFVFSCLSLTLTLLTY